SVDSGGDGVVYNQWASTAVDWSSQYSTGDWSAAQATGAPNVTSYHDDEHAWAADDDGMDDANQWIILGLATNVYATGVTVRESYNNGFVKQIDLQDTSNTWHTVWTGTDSSGTGLVAFHQGFAKTAYLVQAVRIWIDGTH